MAEWKLCQSARSVLLGHGVSEGIIDVVETCQRAFMDLTRRPRGSSLASMLRAEAKRVERLARRKGR